MNFQNILIVICLFFPLSLFAQFQVYGDAIDEGDNTYLLTSDQNNELGYVWNQTQINFNDPFELEFEIFLGCKDGSGADGMSLIFQPEIILSTSLGGSMGFSGLNPSFALEIDTYQNGNGDPEFDHLAIMKNGKANHDSPENLFGPIQAKSTNPNIEDCQWHILKVIWDPQLFNFEVFFDCELKGNYSGDIVNEIFNGNSFLYWGVAGVTGGLNNFQRMRLITPSIYENIDEVPLCEGGTIPLLAEGGYEYNWTPSEGLSATNIPNPLASPTVNTTYIVEITYGCDQTIFDSISIFIVNDSLPVDLGPLDTFVCENSILVLDATTVGASEYIWSNSESQPIIEVDQAGIYSVIATNGNCVSSDQILVNYINLPQVEIGNDTSTCVDVPIILQNKFEHSDYEWQDGSLGNSFLVEEEGTYFLIGENECATIIDSVYVAFEDCQDVYIPNAFSPNNDGYNDYFTIYAENDVVNIHSFQIFDRWGQQLFGVKNVSPNDNSLRWDGRFKGEPLNPQVLVWWARIEFRDGSIKTLSGDVSLLL